MKNLNYNSYHSLLDLTNNLYMADYSIIDNPRYLISQQLKEMLRDSRSKFEFLSDSGGPPKYIYLVVFDVIKRKDSYVLVYNYIRYSEIFFDPLFAYILNEQYSIFARYIVS